jgi:hypothetical protein
MRKVFFLIAVMLTALVFAACNNDKSSTATAPSPDTSSAVVTDTSAVLTDTSTAASAEKNQLAANETYTCTMHNEVMSDHPGKCPKCGMDLVKQEMTAKQKKLKENGNYVKPKE